MNGALLSKKCTLSDLALDMCVSLVIWKEKKKGRRVEKASFVLVSIDVGFFPSHIVSSFWEILTFSDCVSVNSAYCRWTSANEVVKELFPDLEKRMKESH